MLVSGITCRPYALLRLGPFILLMGVLVLFTRRPSPRALSVPLLQVAHDLGILRAGDGWLRERPQSFFGGGKPGVRLLTRFVLVDTNAQPPRQRGQRRTLDHQRDEDDTE